MDKEITPQAIKDRAYRARISVNQLLKSAGVSTAFLWRWEKGKVDKPHAITLGKIEDALSAAEAERAANS